MQLLPFSVMILLTQGQTSELIIVTLHEKSSTTGDRYLFTFTHATTKEVVTVEYLKSQDQSQYTTRYNQFAINTSVVFATAPIGEYLYQVHEQNEDGSHNVLVENGKMFLNPSTDFTYNEYNEQTTFKQYNG